MRGVPGAAADVFPAGPGRCGRDGDAGRPRRRRGRPAHGVDDRPVHGGDAGRPRRRRGRPHQLATGAAPGVDGQERGRGRTIGARGWQQGAEGGEAVGDRRRVARARGVGRRRVGGRDAIRMLGGPPP